MTGAPATRPRSRGFLFCLVGGLLATLSVPPFGWWPLGPIGVGFLVHGLHGSTRWRRAGRAFVFGVGLYGVSLWWMTSFSLPGGLFVAALEAGSVALGVAVAGTHHPRLAIPAALVLADALRSLWPFGGLPLGGLDLGQAGGPIAMTVAFGGRLLLIGVAAAAGAGLEALARRHWRSAGVLLAAAVFVSGAAWAIPDGTHDGSLDGHPKSLRVAIVQGGGRRGTRANDQGTVRAYNAHLTASEAVPSRAGTSRTRSVDLVLWPEDIVDVDDLARSPQLRDLQALVRRTGATLVAGVIEDGGPKRFRNEAVVINPDGSIGGRFDKVRRVPFGEYFPFRSIIERWELASIPGRDAIAGRGPGLVQTTVGRLAVAISYEGFFDDRTRGGVQAGGEAILIPTNASSYVTSQVPTQQLAAAQLRALETGRWVVQAAPTGLSAVVQPDGRVTRRSTVGARQVLRATVTLRHGLTPYVRFNDTPVLLLTIGGLAAVRVGAARRRRQHGGHGSLETEGPLGSP